MILFMTGGVVSAQAAEDFQPAMDAVHVAAARAAQDSSRPVLFFAKTPAKGPREQWAAVPESPSPAPWPRIQRRAIRRLR
jgi:hypothetical protein